MFALREIVIDKLYALALNTSCDVFQQCFEYWQDVDYLFRFFKEHQEALQYYQVDRMRAVELVLLESRLFFREIITIAEDNDSNHSLDQNIFVPLHHDDNFDIGLLETKAYGKKKGVSFLRLYAIRLQDGCYIIVGGLIKTSQALQDSIEGRAMIKRIKYVLKELQRHNLIDAFDIAAIVF
jgi:hypothetical protein